MRRLKNSFLFFFLTLPALNLAYAAELPSDALDTFHRAASEVDSDTYLETVTEDIIFLGTDATERWQGPAFREFVKDSFAAGRGWTYTPVERNIVLSADGKVAWFDEVLNNADLGLCRSSGILVNTAEGWKIAQYNLSVPIPNAIVFDVVEDIAATNATTAGTTPMSGTPELSSDSAASAAGAVGASYSDTSTTSAVTAAPTEPVKETITQQEAEPEPERCRKIRHKTNRQAKC
ncbi:MAG: nuclear transport factor 2 family protein [Pseudomonadota bacterium]